jgi:membrane peptidoglycan carboxypeptidase
MFKTQLYITHKKPQAGKNRRNVVLSQMEKENMITEAQKIRTSKLTHRIKFQTRKSPRRNGLILESIFGLHMKNGLMI